MSLNSNALVTWALTKSLLDLGDEDQTKAEFLINSVSQRVENITGRKLYAQDITEYPEGYGTSTIKLKEYPVNSVTSVFLDTDRDFGDDTAVTDYYLEKTTGLIRLHNTETSEGFEVIKVVYNAGYSTIPEDLQQAVIETVRWNMSRLASGSVGYDTMSGDGMSVHSELSIPTSAYVVIMQYGREKCS